MKHIKHVSPGIYTPDQIRARPLLTVYFDDGEIATYVASEAFESAVGQAVVDMWNARAEAFVTDYTADPNAIGLALIAEFDMTPWDLSADQPTA
jgi:hypothetical protein